MWYIENRGIEDAGCAVRYRRGLGEARFQGARRNTTSCVTMSLKKVSPAGLTILPLARVSERMAVSSRLLQLRML